MAAHQELGQLGIAGLDGIHDPVVLDEGTLGARTAGTELGAVETHQVIEVVAQHRHQHAVMAALDDAVVKVEIAFALVIGFAALEIGLSLVKRQHFTQAGDLLVRHVLGGQAGGHAFQRLTNVE